MITESDKQECEAILDSQRVWRDGDIVSWGYEESYLPYGTTDRYWCKAQKAVFHESIKRFHDLYWIHRHENGNYGMISSSGFSFAPEEIGKKVWVSYRGNLDEFDRQRGDWDDLSKYYAPSDILSLNHPNDSRGNMYLRKGAKKSLALIKEALEAKIFELEGSIRYKTGKLADVKKDLAALTEETKDQIYI